MTLTLELAPEIEAELAEKARRAAIEQLKGKYAHLRERGFSSAAIRAERDKDKQREDRFNETFGSGTT